MRSRRLKNVQPFIHLRHISPFFHHALFLPRALNSKSLCLLGSLLTLTSMNWLKAVRSHETWTNRLPYSRRNNLPPPPPNCFCPFLRHRFSEGTSITTLRPPAPSPLRLKPSTCAFTRKSAGGTAPCAWSCSAASCQVRVEHCPGVCTKQRQRGKCYNLFLSSLLWQHDYIFSDTLFHRTISRYFNVDV